MDVVTKADRKKEQRGVKLALIGSHGVGKTTQLFSLPAKETLFVDLEAGDLAVDEWEGLCVRPKTFEECTHLAALVGGPNPALPNRDGIHYCQRHYDFTVRTYPKIAERLEKINYVFVDSLTHTGRLSFQKTSTTKAGEHDARKAYGEHGQNMIKLLTQFQQARHMHVIFLSILNQRMDTDTGMSSFNLQIEGSKTGEELPGIVDELITMAIIDEFTPNPYRAFVCRKLNRWGYPAKDRAGKLDVLERPDLGSLIEKLKQPRSINLLESLNFELPKPTEEQSVPESKESNDASGSK
jgi:hypothetical protein